MCQVDSWKYIVWAPGNCGSVRLVKLLASDCAVLKLNASDQACQCLIHSSLLVLCDALLVQEWYSLLLKPWLQYIPVPLVEPGIAEAVAWAEAHPAEVRLIVQPYAPRCVHSPLGCLQVKVIVQQANRFAERHLTQLGYLCYTGRLLHAYHQLLQDPQDLPSDAVRYDPDTWS